MLKTRSHRRPPAKKHAAPKKAGARAKPAVKRRRPAVKAKVARKVKAATRAKAPARRAIVATHERVAPHPEQTTITLGPHHVDRHLGEIGFHVHPGPTMHPVGPMAMKHPRATLRHH